MLPLQSACCKLVPPRIFHGVGVHLCVLLPVPDIESLGRGPAALFDQRPPQQDSIFQLKMILQPTVNITEDTPLSLSLSLALSPVSSPFM